MVTTQNSSLNIYTEIATYIITAEKQQTLFDVLLEEINGWMRLQPGFLSANCHKSEDGTRVVTYVEWSTRQHGQNSLQDPKRQGLLTRIQDIGGHELPDTRGYQVPQIIKGLMPEEAVIFPLWEDGTPNAGTPGENTVIVLSETQTNGTVCIVGFSNAPGAGPALHVHTLEDEIWHVIDGEFEFQVGDKIFRAQPGTTVFGPRNLKHTFRYAGETGMGRILITYTPAGIEGFFNQLNEWSQSGKSLAPEVYVDLAHRYGLYFV